MNQREIILTVPKDVIIRLCPVIDISIQELVMSFMRNYR